MGKAWLSVAWMILAWGPFAGAVPETKPATSQSLSRAELADFRQRLLSATTKHLDLLLDANGKVSSLKGKGTDGATADAFYTMYELTGNPKYRAAAIALADEILAEMRKTKHGVLFIKEKEKGTGETIAGGGPPALGSYVAAVAYICHKEGKRGDDLKYLAGVVDNYPWNENGWWAATIDINTGQPKEPITKPSPVNKTASMAMAAAIVSFYIREIDPPLSARLKSKADQCIYKKIIPAREPDGFWHYGLTGKDPKNKDILGYFMLTTNELIHVQQCTDSYKDAAFQSALDKACAFAFQHIAPMTDPNAGPAAASPHSTVSTPAHFSVSGDLKRGFALGPILFAGRNFGEGMKIADCFLKAFPYGNAGTEGGHAEGPAVAMLVLVTRELEGKN